MADKRLIVVVAVILMCCCGCGSLLSALVPFGEWVSMGRSDYQRQCDIALGPEPATTPTSLTTTPSAAPAAAPTDTETSRPTANPYAELEFAADDPDVTDRDRECASAMRVAPHQDQPLRQAHTGPAAVCAADLALRYPEAGGTAETAEYLRDVIYGASVATTTGQCAVVRAPRAVAEENCGDPKRGATVIALPETIREQAFCGQLVDPVAVSPGDLVFWAYRDNAATRAGIAIAATEMVSVDAGEFVRLSIPDDGRVQIKRVLGEALS
ncbi:hypothetical protein [Nocardia sp. X0981]